MQIIDCEQRSPEWVKIRLGLPTSSNFSKIVTTTGAPSNQKLKYLYKLAGEKVSGVAEESYQSAAMIRGAETENEARKMYRMITGQKVEEVGFCLEGGFGASPDALVEDNGLLEIKCPISSTQVSYLLANKFPMDYFQQCQGQMLVTGRKWCDFMSYFAGLKPLIIKIHRDEAFIEALESALKEFCIDLENVVKEIS